MTPEHELYPPTSPSPQRLRLPSFPGSRRSATARRPGAMATYVLIGFNVLVFLADYALGRAVTAYGALVPRLVLQYGQWWRLIAAAFLHANIIHISLNLYALYGLGRLTERFFGLKRFLIIYGLALLGSGVLVTLFSPMNTPSVGASGAIMGVLGALVVYFWFYRDLLVGGRGFLGQLARMALINIGIGLLPGISLWGHLGGFVTGAVAGFLLVPRYVLLDATNLQEADRPADGSPGGSLAVRALHVRAWLGILLVGAGELGLLALAFQIRG